MYINKVTVFGNLTRDPEAKNLPSGTLMVEFSIATNNTFKDKEGNKKETVEYHNIVAFGKQAEVITQYVKKGSSLLVEGRLSTRSWEKEGVKQYRTEIITESFQFGPKKEESAPAPKRVAGTSLPYPDEEVNPDDIPF